MPTALAAAGAGGSADGHRSGPGSPVLWRFPDRTPDPFVRRGVRKHAAAWSAAALRERAAPWRLAHYATGEPGDCDPARANWRYERAFDLAAVKDLLADWKKWFEIEIAIEEAAGIGCGYREMLDEDIDDEIIVLLRGRRAYIWDGWHAVAAALISGRTTLKAIVGVPHQDAAPQQR
ncbi:MAG: hypothetical protein IPI73_12125 [Betaproteobacteria bacterium]|nr:hypothetical protein [Betaproteobacteria bacterium]